MGTWSLPPAFVGLVQRLAGPVPALVPLSSAMPSPRWTTDTYVPAPAPAPVSRPAPAPALRPAPPAPAPAPAPPPGATAGRIALDGVDSRWVKDPAFANDGQPIGDRRFAVFGDLRRFYLKGFDVAKTPDGKPGLRFAQGELPIDVKGLPPGIDGLWAPEVVVRGDRVILLYAGGRMPPGGLDWPSFRLRRAEVSLADFTAAAQAGKPVPFEDKGTLFPDQTTFGDDPRFAMIDPAYYQAPDGAAYLTYTVVKDGVPGQRRHEEFVRIRRVDPDHPEVALGPDMPLIDGWAGGLHDGVAEAQDIVDVGGRPVLYVSSRAGDKDQRVYAAPLGADFGRVADGALKPVLTPGGEAWRANAVGSTSGAVLDGQLFLLHQGMDADGRFSLGFEASDAPA